MFAWFKLTNFGNKGTSTRMRFGKVNNRSTQNKHKCQNQRANNWLLQDCAYQQREKWFSKQCK